MSRKDFPHPCENSDDLNIHDNGTITIQHARKHRKSFSVNAIGG